MKKKMLLITALAALMMLGAVLPAMAQPSTIAVTAKQVGGFKAGTLTYELNDGGIFHFDAETLGKFSLYTTSTTTPAYVFDVWGTINAMINTKTDNGEFAYKMVLSYVVAGQVVGSFEGASKADTVTNLYNAQGIPIAVTSTNILHTVLQGKGMFEGQTLKLDGIRPALDPYVVGQPANPTTWEGTLMTR